MHDKHGSKAQEIFKKYGVEGFEKLLEAIGTGKKVSPEEEYVIKEMNHSRRHLLDRPVKFVVKLQYLASLEISRLQSETARYETQAKEAKKEVGKYEKALAKLNEKKKTVASKDLGKHDQEINNTEDALNHFTRKEKTLSKARKAHHDESEKIQKIVKDVETYMDPYVKASLRDLPSEEIRKHIDQHFVSYQGKRKQEEADAATGAAPAGKGKDKQLRESGAEAMSKMYISDAQGSGHGHLEDSWDSDALDDYGVVTMDDFGTGGSDLFLGPGKRLKSNECHTDPANRARNGSRCVLIINDEFTIVSSLNILLQMLICDDMSFSCFCTVLDHAAWEILHQTVLTLRYSTATVGVRWLRRSSTVRALIRFCAESRALCL